MSDYNPNFHQRRSIRLKGYDYSKAGLYFITICVQNRECLFGEIRPVGADLRVCPDPSLGTHKGVPRQKLDRQNDIRKMILNDAGKMIVKWYCELQNKYPDIRCHEWIVMPNHFHSIIEKTGEYTNNHPDGDGSDPQDAHVGAPLRGRPNDYKTVPDHDPITVPDHHPITEPKFGPNNKKFGATIGDVVDWFKTMTTNEYIRGVKNRGWKRFDGKLWQRNYWEHIIRDEGSYDRIAEYIIQNPSKWNDDQLNADQKS
jgi:REP element-mobilizing transposase RayT